MKNHGYRPGALASLIVRRSIVRRSIVGGWVVRGWVVRGWVVRGCALLALGGSIGCGNIEEGAAPPEERIPEVENPPDPCLNSLLAECQDSAPPSVEMPPMGNVTPPEPPSEAELVKAAAENVLRLNCGRCHGEALTREAAEAGMNYIDDMDQLVENGQVRPLDSAGSRVIQFMREGIMPPRGIEPRPSRREIDQVAAYIDNPLYWPPQPAAPRCDDQLVSFDDVYRAVAEDLGRADAEDRRFLRYLTLTNRYDSGVCGTELDTDRWALSKAVNMLSVRAQIEPPVAIDRAQTIYRIDLRHYDWDREIVVNGESFRDGWEAIIANNPYAVPFVGNDADEVRGDAETDVAVMFADAMQAGAAFGNLYYALIGVDVTQPLSTFISEELDIDVAANIAEGEVIRAGTTRSILTRQDRVLERHQIENRRGAYWQSFDFEPDVVNDSIFVNPFGFNQGGTEAIFSLPNGMLGFIIADADDNIVEESNILLDTFANDYIARTAVSCSGCHAQGFNEAVDEVRQFVLDNRIGFGADDFEAVREIYVEAEEFASVIEEDSRVFLDALADAGLPVLQSDPVSSTFLAFDDDLDLARAAGDLGLSPAQLERDLRELDPALQVLQSLTVDRDDFTALYLESLCVLHRPNANQPDPALCAALTE